MIASYQFIKDQQHTDYFDETVFSLASSIEWRDIEVVHMTRTDVVRSEGVDCLSDICVVLICHILDEDRVPDIMINISHIQRPGSLPGDGDRGGIVRSCQSSCC